MFRTTDSGGVASRKIIRVDSSELPETPLAMEPVLGEDKIYNSDLPSDERDKIAVMSQVAPGGMFGSQAASRETIDDY